MTLQLLHSEFPYIYEANLIFLYISVPSSVLSPLTLAWDGCACACEGAYAGHLLPPPHHPAFCQAHGRRGNEKKCPVCFLKGTVRPDWICMRVESPLKGHQPLYVFDFSISELNIWNNLKVLSCFMQNWTQPPACSDHGLHSILSSYWLAHCYLMKKSTKVALYFGLDCGMM